MPLTAMKIKLMKRVLVGASFVALLTIWQLSRRDSETNTTFGDNIEEGNGSVPPSPTTAFHIKSPNAKVLVWSINPRSGSSYLSEILTVSMSAALVFEPLRYLYEDVPKARNATFVKVGPRRRIQIPRQKIKGTKKVKEFVPLR